MILNSTNVNNIFNACINTEAGQNCTHVKSYKNTYFFNTALLEKHKNEINELIDQLPWIENGNKKFIQLRQINHTNDSAVWTSNIDEMDHLIALAIAIKKICFYNNIKNYFTTGNRTMLIKR